MELEEMEVVVVKHMFYQHNKHGLMKLDIHMTHGMKIIEAN